MYQEYPESFIDKESEEEAWCEIAAHGFKKDLIISEDIDRPVFGINLTCGWPLPKHLESKYNKLIESLLKITPGTYGYPFSFTHITLVTFVNFKNHQYPSEKEICSLRELKNRIYNSIVEPIIIRLKKEKKMKPFKIDIGLPEIQRNAIILRISNPTGEVSLLRNEIDKKIKSSAELKDLLPEMNIPEIIHSTILRFCKCDIDVASFFSGFNSIKESLNFNSNNRRFGEAMINELLLTEETKPYMRDGNKIELSLRESNKL